MPNILDFPNELLQRIVNDVPRFDLLSLALSNKSFYAFTKGALKKHLALRERYSTLTFGTFLEDFEAHTCDDTKSALLFLGLIYEDPEIAYYPRVIQLGNRPDVYPDVDLDEIYSKRNAVVDVTSDRLKALVDGCDFVLCQDKEVILTQILDPERDGAAMALLLALLPNLKTFIIQDWFPAVDCDPIQDLVQRVAWSNRNVMSARHGKALTHLSEFALGTRHYGYGRSMESFQSFAMLPSIRVLRGQMIHAEIFEWPESFLPKSSNVTEISIDCSAISSGAFEALFSGISALANFKYQYERPAEGAGYDRAGIVEALRKHAASTLQSLDLEGSEIPPFAVGGSQLVGSLRMFTSLKSLRTEDLAFELPGSVDTSEDEEDRKVENEGPTMDRLVDLLPPSIEHLTLIQMMDDGNMEELLRDMAVSKTERVPRLQRISFESPDSITPEMRAALKESGLKENGITLSWEVTI